MKNTKWIKVCNNEETPTNSSINLWQNEKSQVNINDEIIVIRGETRNLMHRDLPEMIVVHSK